MASDKHPIPWKRLRRNHWVWWLPGVCANFCRFGPALRPERPRAVPIGGGLASAPCVVGMRSIGHSRHVVGGPATDQLSWWANGVGSCCKGGCPSAGYVVWWCPLGLVHVVGVWWAWSMLVSLQRRLQGKLVRHDLFGDVLEGGVLSKGKSQAPS